jgi:hypothetical protein
MSWIKIRGVTFNFKKKKNKEEEEEEEEERVGDFRVIFAN